MELRRKFAGRELEGEVAGWEWANDAAEVERTNSSENWGNWRPQREGRSWK